MHGTELGKTAKRYARDRYELDGTYTHLGRHRRSPLGAGARPRIRVG
jgi:hypothetical protein